MYTAKKSELEKVRKNYINAEVNLLNILTGKELEMLNEMIEANEEYIELLTNN